MKAENLTAVLVPGAMFALGICMGCPPPAVAKTEYSAQKHACVDLYADSSADLALCLEQVDNAWNDAGARPAASDGGSNQ